MANKTTENKSQNAVSESVYTAAELIAAAKTVFHTSPDIVTAALRVAGAQKATLAEATRIVEDFKKKEV